MVPCKHVWLAIVAVLICGGWGAGEEPAASANRPVLYNGITLPAVWPPVRTALGREPMPTPYLEHPPAVISIDVGRQLFVDDFLISETTLNRVFHRPEYHAACPVLKADQPWEQQGRAPCAMPFSDGAWYDPHDGLFKLWYIGGYLQTTCYATSRDGVHWEKPRLDTEPGTNIVLRQVRDSGTIWLDHHEKDAKRRWKMFITTQPKGGSGWVLALRESPDGIHWSEPVGTTPGLGDRSTVFFNPFRKVWVWSIRIGHGGRARAYREHADAVAGMQWTAADQVLWTGADRLDPHNPVPEYENITRQLYNLDAVAYESVLLGLFSIWQGPDNGVCNRLKIQKRNEVLVGFSRDGFHWDRPDRRPFLPVNPSEGAWNWGNVQSAGGGCLVVGDKLYFYCSGRAITDKFWDGNAQTGLAILRRDGFASMQAASQECTLTTRPLRFTGKHLFVNVAAAQGELRAEVLDEQGHVIAPLSRDNCKPLSLDSTLAAVAWQGAENLDALSGRPVRFRFYLRGGDLFAFWVSPDARGASRGYVAAGGPGFSGDTDTVGSAAYEAAREHRNAK